MCWQPAPKWEQKVDGLREFLRLFHTAPWYTHTHTFWLCKPERLAAHYHTTGGLHTGDWVFLCMCAPAHLRALSPGHNNNCSIVCVCVCARMKVSFNQEERKTVARENYWICFRRWDNYQIKQIPLVRRLIHPSNQQAGRRRQHLLPSGDLRQMWRWSTFRGAAQIPEEDCFVLLKSRFLAWKRRKQPS